MHLEFEMNLYQFEIIADPTSLTNTSYFFPVLSVSFILVVSKPAVGFVSGDKTSGSFSDAVLSYLIIKLFPAPSRPKTITSFYRFKFIMF